MSPNQEKEAQDQQQNQDDLIFKQFQSKTRESQIEEIESIILEDKKDQNFIESNTNNQFKRKGQKSQNY